MKSYHLLALLFLLFGCSHTLPKKEAEQKVEIQTEIFKKSSLNGEYDQAIGSIHKIIKLNKEGGLELYEADMYNYLAELYVQKKEYNLAIENYEKSAKEYKLEPNRGEAYYNATAWLARLYMMKGRYKKSLYHHKEAIAFLERVEIKEKNLQFATAYGNIAILYQKLGQYEKALAFNHKSLDLLLKYYPDKNFFISTNYNNISAIKNDTGDYPSALKYLKKSLEIYIKKFGADSPILSSGYNNMAIHYVKIGENRKALAYLKKAYEVRDKNSEDMSLATLYDTMGGVYRLLKEYDKSLLYFQKSIELYKRLHKESSLDIASTYLNFGKYYEDKKEFDHAMSYYEKGKKIEEKILGRENLIVAEVYEAIGMIYMAKGENRRAKEYLMRVINIRKKLLGEENHLTKQAYEDLGGLQYNRKEYRSAYLNIKKSFDAFMLKRENFFMILDSADKRSYIKENREKVQLLLESASELRDSEVASVTFDDWLNYKGTLFERENAISRLYEKGDSNVEAKIDTMLLKKKSLAKLYPHESKETERLEREISAIEIELEPKISEELDRVSRADILKGLKDDELYIDYAKVGKRYFVFTLDSDDTLTFYRYSMSDSQEVSRLTIAFRNNLRGARDSRKIASRLYDILMKHINLEKKSFIISSDGLLRLLPFEALYNGRENRYLIEDREIRYIPSGKELIRLYSKKSKRSKKTIVIFDNPDFEADVSSTHRGVRNDAIFKMKFGRLPETEVEAKAIKRVFSNRNIIEYQGKEANEENLLAIAEPKILHIATHGFFLNSNLSNPMLKSGIALSGANKSLSEGRDDGVVTALKLSGLNLKNTELVVLSACKTGVVAMDSTDGISGLSKAFIQAGAGNIVASLWSVNDKGTKDLMELFYQEIAKGEGYSRALQEAKLKMIEDKVSPFIWASFFIYGL